MGDEDELALGVISGEWREGEREGSEVTLRRWFGARVGSIMWFQIGEFRVPADTVVETDSKLERVLELKQSLV